MKKFLLKYNLEMFSFVVLTVLLIRFLCFPDLSMEHRILSAYMIIAILHEFEEKRTPGGFFELMGKKFGLPEEKELFEVPGLFVTVFWIVLLGVPSAFPTPLLIMPLACLGIFEAFIHTAGIRIHRLTKPYTPGLVTAWMMAAVSIYTIRYLSTETSAGTADYIIGIILFILSFFVLENFVIRSFGMTFGDMRRKILGH